MSNSVFLDTSAIIAKKFHIRHVREKIERHLAGYKNTVTGSVVKKEYIFRVLWEMSYILRTIDEFNSFDDALRFISDNLSRQQRKRSICTQIMLTVNERDLSEDRTARAKLLLQDMLTNGIAYFDMDIDEVLDDVGCSCSKVTITRKGKYYEFSEDKCSKVNSCGIRQFLDKNKAKLRTIRNELSKISVPTDELKGIVLFIDKYLAYSKDIVKSDPCSSVGDLLISLESKDVGDFMTLNYKESLHLCKIMKQRFVKVPSNPRNDIEVIE